MRVFCFVAASAIALAGCGPKASDSTPNATVTAASDNMTILPSETAMEGNAAAATSPISTDDYLMKAAMSDMYEVAAGKIAAAKASNPAVRDFAQNMVTAHTATTAGLKAAVARDGVAMTPPPALDARHQALIDALNAADKGAAFDMLYKDQQRNAHTEALTTHQSYAASGDKPAIKAFAADTAPKVQMHIDMLAKLS